MTSPSRKIIKWGGVLAGSAAVASISAFATTKYLLKMAVDREEPKLMKLAEKRVAGFIEDDAFFKARIEAGDRLSKKASTTVERETDHHCRPWLARLLVRNLRYRGRLLGGERLQRPVYRAARP